MKKLKANAILTTFVLLFCLLLLGVFSTDIAYVTLSRYKVQKAADSLALEYAAYLSQNPSNLEEENYRKKSIGEKESLFNQGVSGLSDFKIREMSYKKNGDVYIVKIQTTARVLPAFLRFVFVRGIRVWANSYATTEPLDTCTNSSSCNSPHYIESWNPAEAESDYMAKNSFIFSPEKPQNYNPLKQIRAITYKEYIDKDKLNHFSIKYDIGDNLRETNIGGFFIFGGYGNNDEYLTDLGKKAVDEHSGDFETIDDINGYTCINIKNKNGEIKFNLAQDEEVSDDKIRRINRIIILRAMGGDIDNACTDKEQKDVITDFEAIKDKIPTAQQNLAEAQSKLATAQQKLAQAEYMLNQAKSMRQLVCYFNPHSHECATATDIVQQAQAKKDEAQQKVQEAQQTVQEAQALIDSILNIKNRAQQILNRKLDRGSVDTTAGDKGTNITLKVLNNVSNTSGSEYSGLSAGTEHKYACTGSTKNIDDCHW